MVDVWGIGEMIHQGKAGGYGYDKFTSALSGAVIDGHTIYNHSVGNYNKDNPQYPDLNQLMQRYGRNSNKQDEAYWRNEADKIGASFTNYHDGKYTSLYYVSGLDRLRSFGYKIIQAI